MTRALVLMASASLFLCGVARAQSTATSPRDAGPAAAATRQQPPARTPVAAKADSSASSAKAFPFQDDADQLVNLAQQLKTEIDETNEYTLSLKTLRRAEEIEKVAKNLEKKLQSKKK
jgi:hypothetical protein